MPPTRERNARRGATHKQPAPVGAKGVTPPLTPPPRSTDFQATRPGSRALARELGGTEFRGLPKDERHGSDVPAGGGGSRGFDRRGALDSFSRGTDVGGRAQPVPVNRPIRGFGGRGCRPRAGWIARFASGLPVCGGCWRTAPGTRDDAIKFRATVARLHPNWARSASPKGLPLSDLLDKYSVPEGEPGLSARTLERYRTRLSVALKFWMRSA